MKPRILDLPHGHRTLISEADLPLVDGLTLYRGTNGYVYFSTWKDGRTNPRTLHRLLIDAPSGTHVDHINGDKLDNRRENLRVVSPSINQANRKRLNKNNRSGIRGVAYRPSLSARNPWRAQIMVDRRQIHLGLFATEAEAVARRRAAELEHYGELCP